MLSQLLLKTTPDQVPLHGRLFIVSKIRSTYVPQWQFKNLGKPSIFDIFEITYVRQSLDKIHFV